MTFTDVLLLLLYVVGACESSALRQMLKWSGHREYDCYSLPLLAFTAVFWPIIASCDVAYWYTDWRFKVSDARDARRMEESQRIEDAVSRAFNKRNTSEM